MIHVSIQTSHSSIIHKADITIYIIIIVTIIKNNNSNKNIIIIKIITISIILIIITIITISIILIIIYQAICGYFPPFTMHWLIFAWTWPQWPRHLQIGTVAKDQALPCVLTGLSIGTTHRPMMMVPLGPMPIQNFHHVGSLYIEINLGRVWKGVFRQFHLRETSSILLITLSQVSYKEGSHNRRCKLILNVNDAAAMQIARFTMVRKWVHSLPSFCQSVQELNLSHFSEQVHHHFTNIISLGPFWPLPSLSIYRTDCN